MIGRVLYDVANGRGRGRGSVKGTQRTGSWTTTLLSTGESPAVASTQDGGTRARVMTLWGGPFGEATESSAQLVNELTVNLKQNFGHAGPALVARRVRGLP